MLTPEIIATIRSTVPVLTERGEDLTRYFYRRLFEGNPEVAPLFNPAHQTSGRQQRALAAAICAYAEHIDNLPALTDAVAVIAHKHASLGVRPEHYPVIGEHLLGSIRELLSLPVDSPILRAWGAAYGALAEVFIKAEAGIYEAHRKGNGWDGFRIFRVAQIRDESQEIRSFYLVPADGSAPGMWRAGQYITVRVPGRGGHTTMRNYSLSNPPGEGHFRISVKRERGDAGVAPDGVVSNHLHDGITVGDEVEVGPPCGTFVFDPDRGAVLSRPVVFLSGGVGVTPLIAMLHTAVQRRVEGPLYFFHGARNSAVHAFRDEAAQLSKAAGVVTHVRYSEPTAQDVALGRCDSEGFYDRAALETLLPGMDASFYLCGPILFLDRVGAALREAGTAEGDIHREFFGPAEALGEAT